LRPLDSDFNNEGTGLEDHEMLWITRIPNGDLALKEVQGVQDAERFSTRQNYLFQSALPSLIEDVLNGKIEGYAGYGDKKPIENFRERMKQFGGSRLNYAPLTKAVELFSIVYVNEAQYRSKPEFLSLVWEDANSSHSGRAFAGVYLDSLPRNAYLVKTPQGNIPLRDFFKTEWFHYQPVYIRTNTLEYSPRSRAEADFLREKVKNGEWKNLEWEDGALNISGQRRIDLEPEQVLQFAGNYQVAHYDGSDSQSIFFTAQKDHLLADWEERFELSHLYPFHVSSFFSRNGDLYLFERENEEMRLFVVTDRDTLYGKRVGK